MDGASVAGNIEVQFWAGWILNTKVSGEFNPMMVGGRGLHLRFECSEGVQVGHLET